MARERFVKFSRDAVYLWQAGPGNGREIVVLVVQADVVGQDVEGSVVGVCFGGCERVQGAFLFLGGGDALLLEFFHRLGTARLDLGEKVVLGNEMSCARVQRAGEERAEEKVQNRLERSSAHLSEDVVKGELGDEVQNVNRGEWRAVYKHGS